jgi:hypothetical protein
MRRIWSRLRCGGAQFWQGVREWCGDTAYERYLKCAVRGGLRRPLSPAEFYVEQLNKKYSRPNRCC